MAIKKVGRLTLAEWINQESVAVVAKLLKVEKSSVRHWRRGHCLPRTDQMQKIKKYSKGAVSYDAMIDGQKTPYTKK